jgi:hypothetical protein
VWLAVSIAVNRNHENRLDEQEVPGCKPHNNMPMPTTNARKSKNVNEKDGEPAKNVEIVNARRLGI